MYWGFLVLVMCLIKWCRGWRFLLWLGCCELGVLIDCWLIVNWDYWWFYYGFLRYWFLILLVGFLFVGVEGVGD